MYQKPLECIPTVIIFGHDVTRSDKGGKGSDCNKVNIH